MKTLRIWSSINDKSFIEIRKNFCTSGCFLVEIPV